MISASPIPASPSPGRESALLKIVEDDVVRRIVRLADLLQDHRALALDLLAVEVEY